MTTTVPVVVAARHVRLSAAHLELLFGAGTALVGVCALPPTGSFATAVVVDVRGAAGGFKSVRVVGPLVKSTEVRVHARDAASAGLVAGAGCTLEGPRGTVVLAGGVVVGLRRLALTAEALAANALSAGSAATVTVRGERERELRDVVVMLAPASYLEVDIDDANAIEIGPLATAAL